MPQEISDTGSEIDDSFVLASFLRGNRVLENLSKHRIFHKLLPDVANYPGITSRSTRSTPPTSQSLVVP